MFKRRRRRANPFQARSRSGRQIVYDGQVWSYFVLVILLAVLTSPLWLFSPPGAVAVKNDVRLAGAYVWFGLSVLAILAGRSWGLYLVMNHPDRTVSREYRNPWKGAVLWSYSGDRIEYVSLTVNAEGIARIEAWLRERSTILIERGANVADLHRLGGELARCWQVPFRVPPGFG